MPGAMSFDGVVSGMDTSSIIQQLLDIDSKPMKDLQAKKTVDQNKITVWKEATADLLSFKVDAFALSQTSLFTQKTINSSDETVLTASNTGSPINGTYTLTVNKLAQAHQMLSNGFDDQDTTPVGAGTITFEFGKGNLDPKTKLDFLNGQTGVSRGSIKITDKNGNYATIDISAFTDVKEIINAINTNDNIDVTASINAYGNGINIVGNSGAGNLKVEEVNGGNTAHDLGIYNTGAAAITGSSIYNISTDTRLNLLNDGNGVRTAGTGQKDIRITKKDGSIVDVELSSAVKISDVLSAIKAADPTGKLDASLVDDTHGNKVIKITDNSGGLGPLSIAALNSSHALDDLGLNVTTSDNTLTGGRTIGGIDTVLLKSLHGGSGVSFSALTDVSITTHDGVVHKVLGSDLVNASTLQEVIDKFNTVGGSSFRAELNPAGNGIQIEDLTTGSTNFSIGSNASTDATTGLGIANVAGTTDSTIKGSDLELKYISENTQLSTLNAGAGVNKGVIKFTNRAGQSVNIDFSADYIKTIGDVVDKINTDGAAYAISAAVNSTGDGIVINDNVLPAQQTGNLIIDNYGGTFASDLNIVANTSSGTVDGAYEYSIDVAATDKLQDVRDKINSLNTKVKASIINDGSVSGAYKLMLSSTNTGESGQIIADINLSGGEGLSLSTISSAQNAVFTLGSTGIGSKPSVIYKSSNTVNDVISGISLQLKNVSTTPVTLTLSNDYDTIKKSVSSFVDSYNKVIGFINDKTHYDPETNVAGELQGNYTINQIKNDIFSSLTDTVQGLDSTMNNIGQIGLTFGDDGTLTVNDDALQKALESNLDGVKDLFTYSVNVGSAANGATASSSAVTAPYTNAGGIDGNTSYEDFASGKTGWQAPGGTGTYYEVDLKDVYTLQKFDLYSIDTSALPADSYALKNFDFQYWDMTKNDWVTEQSYSGNQGGRVVYYFSSPITTNKVRINNAVGNDASARITDLQLYESRGIGKKLDDLIAKFTDVSNGSIMNETDSINSDVDVIDQQLDVWTDRLATKEQYYRDQFNQLESVMQKFKSTGSWLTTQLDSINTGWSYRNG